MTYRTLYLTSLIALLACGRSEPAEAPPQAAESKPASGSADWSAAGASTFVLAASSGAKLTLSIEGDRIELKSGERQLLGRSKGDKRYYHRGTEAFVEVKAGEEGFKVRTPDSKLLWKVKIADDKIKVSDNEENQNPWVIKTKYEDKAKVEDPTEKEIGEVKFGSDGGRIKIKDASGSEPFVLESGRRSAAYGVLLMSAVPQEQREIILAELLARGK